MNFKPKKDLKNPYESAWLFPSRFLFLWAIPFMWKGYRNTETLKLDDLYNVPSNNESKKLTDKLEQNWFRECERAKKKNTRARFYKACRQTYWRFYAKVFFFGAINEWILRIALMVLLKLTIKSFEEGTPESEYKYVYSGCFVATTVVYAFLLHLPVFETYKLGMIIRVATSSLIYRKALKLSKSGQNQTNVGQMVNLLSNDVNRFDMFLNFLKYIIISPIQTLIFVYFVWQEFDTYATLAGFSYLVLLIPIQYLIGQLSSKYRKLIAEKTDSRGNYMSEIIIAIRVIKMYGWEKPFSALINHIRKIEVKWLKKRALLTALYISIYCSASKVMMYLTILAYILFTDGRLTSDKVFFSLAIYEHIKLNMVFFIPNAIAFFMEVMVSINRIEVFLNLDEKKKSSSNFVNHSFNGNSEEISISMEHVKSSWSDDKVTLDDVSFKVGEQQLVVIAGPVGSSKTSLLHALLSELPILEGKCTVNGTFSYASQEPWIFPANIKQNILFGSPYDKVRYDEIIRVCALQDDLRQLPYGDNTIVGERGVSLSGGQKARVNLARSLYQEADIYLMDDPLSAVDARVSRHIFDKCIKKYLRGKLRILVTHQLQYLPQADHIIVFNNGKIMGQGSFEELVNRGIDFVNLMANESEEDSARKDSVQLTGIKLDEKILEDLEPEEKNEKMLEGAVSFSNYRDYFLAGKANLQLSFIIFFFISSQIVYSFGDWWLAYWTNEEEEFYNHTTDEPSSKLEAFFDKILQIFSKNLSPGEGDFDRTMYFWWYTGIFSFVFILLKIRGLSFFSYCMRISINIHNRMFSSAVRAPVKFYDDNPSGRIMNRFTKDLGSMDDMLPASFFDFLIIYLQALGVVVVVAWTNVYIIIPTVILVLVLWFVRSFYITTARVIKRLEAITKSPIFTQVGSSIQGLTTIRASGKENLLIEQFDNQQDLHSCCWFMFIGTTRWFGITLDLMICIFLMLSMLSFILIDSKSSSSNVGLAFSSILSLGGIFQWGMRQSAETENYMTSVERALEYAKLEPEAPLESTEDKKPPKNWPSKGEIVFKNVSLSYEEKDVLRDLSFEIKEKEKIGIVGRTGAGKSSVIVALFRMTEPRGEIYIDQVKVNDIGLHELRKSISIIPQDPVLFSGTIRYNLDPFEQFPDDDLWKALEEVDLKHAVPALDFKVSDSGSNFSVGQRQLVCLARAILRKNKIIVMDEATANVDPSTDNFIQKTIRNKFADCTIITIAHRLNSVMDCHRILVLDNGSLKEYDSPHILLQNQNGILNSMINHTGRNSSAYLRRIAFESYTKRQKISNINLEFKEKEETIEENSKL